MTAHLRLPEAPPHPNGLRYSAATAAVAKQLAAAGWSQAQIAALIERRTGHRPTRQTVKRWINEDFAKRARETNNARYARRRADERRARFHHPERVRDFTDRELLSLRKDGFTMEGITKIAKRFYGLDLTVNQVRYHLYRLGAPKSPSKVRAGHDLAARRRAQAAA